MININNETDKRANKDYLSAPFKYTNYDYPYWFEEHYYLFNVDLVFLGLPIMAAAF